MSLIAILASENLNNFNHVSVLLHETVDGLNCRNGLIYVDATLGGGGHSYEIAKRIVPDGRLISTDVDTEAIEAAKTKLADYMDIVTIYKASYTKIPEILTSLNVDVLTGGIVFDLGASYHQLTKAERGFSFSKEAPLDMRFGDENPVTAYDIINSYSKDELSRIFWEYGEERFSRKVADRIVEKRQLKAIKTTTELADIVKSAIYAKNMRIHPATRVFQAIRIAVNNELTNFENTLKNVIPILGKNARIAVISFHSLEDRLVKNLFKYYSTSCKCPVEQMVCTCEPRQLEIVTKKPITATEEEIRQNPSARSAKLRVATKI